jgi:aspartyl-tRNA(Asn)/glutamyl-tRNA(Gln) amidotransferase subunit A
MSAELSQLSAAVPSKSGSRTLEGYRPSYTATVVQKLSDAGARRLGKATQDEFAMGSSNENSAFGPALNSSDRRRVPGGSCGGRAAAVAAGLASWAAGTATGGAIRQPAALSGILGLKPTYRSCSRYGLIALASSLDQMGPLTRDVSDATLPLVHMVGHDPNDSTSLAFPVGVRLPSSEDLSGVRLGVPDKQIGAEGGIEFGVRASFDAALDPAQKLDASLWPCKLPHATRALSLDYIIAPGEASANHSRFDGVRHGLRVTRDADLATRSPWRLLFLKHPAKYVEDPGGQLFRRREPPSRSLGRTAGGRGSN